MGWLEPSLGLWILWVAKFGFLLNTEILSHTPVCLPLDSVTFATQQSCRVLLSVCHGEKVRDVTFNGLVQDRCHLPWEDFPAPPSPATARGPIALCVFPQH